MDFFQAQELFSTMNPGKAISYQFDESCQRQHEIVYTDGLPNLLHHVECNKVKVTVEGAAPIYVPIIAHRLTIPWSDMKNLINMKKDVYIDDATLQAISDDKSGEGIIQVCAASGLSADAVNQKIASLKSKQTKQP